jgi:hypothetical protein
MTFCQLSSKVIEEQLTTTTSQRESIERAESEQEESMRKQRERRGEHEGATGEQVIRIVASAGAKQRRLS